MPDEFNNMTNDNSHYIKLGGSFITFPNYTLSIRDKVHGLFRVNYL